MQSDASFHELAVSAFSFTLEKLLLKFNMHCNQAMLRDVTVLVHLGLLLANIRDFNYKGNFPSQITIMSFVIK